MMSAVLTEKRLRIATWFGSKTLKAVSASDPPLISENLNK